MTTPAHPTAPAAGPALRTAAELLRADTITQQCLPYLRIHQSGRQRLADHDVRQLVGALNHCAITRACCAVMLRVLLAANDSAPAPWGPHAA